jgi:multidrug resistance efflux pump
MSEAAEATPRIVIEPVRRFRWGRWVVAGTIVAGATLWIFGAGLKPSRLLASRRAVLETLPVDRGDLDWIVTESGTLESADNATVRCQVEALIGLTGGTSTTQVRQAGAQAAGQAGGGTAQTSPQPAQGAAPAAAKKTGAAPKGGAGGAKAKATGAGAVSKLKTAAGGTAAGGAGASTATSSAATTTTGVKRPDIRSFDYIVEPYIPLKSKTVSPAQAPKPKVQQPQQQGGGRRGGSTNTVMEQPGATRIISILPEGSRVKKGDLVCELDSAAFKDERQAQLIHYLEAQSFVEQARSILEVNEISSREYRDGIYPQDLQLIRQYITMCQTEAERARRMVVWSRDVGKKGFRAPAQVKADELALQQAEIGLSEAQGMEVRLEKFTGQRILTAREAKIKAIQADLHAQEQKFELEKQRLQRLEKMIENCSLYAPRDGIVVYANQSSPWGRVEVQIQEGATVRQSQPIFYVPNPKHMQVKARINESKVALIHTGQTALIRIDAFPDHPLHGTIAQITAIPAPANGSMPDVQVYYATVNIETGGFDDLRPGLSAEVMLRIESRENVVRVPLQTLRWLDNRPYVALAHSTPDGPTWTWTAVELGMSDAMHAEVLSGISPGDRVVAHPGLLPSPRPVRNQASRVHQG